LGWAIVLCCAVQVSQRRRRTAGGADAVEQAERGLETLEAFLKGARTRADYTRAMDGFRAVLPRGAGDVHAPDSVNAVADLLAEQGRGLHDAKSLKAAVGSMSSCGRSIPEVRCGGSTAGGGADLSERSA